MAENKTKTHKDSNEKGVTKKGVMMKNEKVNGEQQKVNDDGYLEVG